MDTKPKTYKMLKTVPGSRDGLTVETFTKDQTYNDLNPELAEQFFHQGVIEEVTEAQARKLAAEKEGEADTPAPQKAQEGKADRPAVAPLTPNEGEAGIDPATQRIEELVATARDIYGRDVDSTMTEEQVRAAIENAKGGAAARETKVTGPAETKPAAKAETKHPAKAARKPKH